MPNWILVLEAANYDPLRAKEIYENVDKIWWERWALDRTHRLARLDRINKNA